MPEAVPCVRRRWLVINPNTSAGITDELMDLVGLHAPAGTVIAGATARFGFPVIATRASFAIASHAALDAFARHGSPCGAIILGCFGDPGLAALREVAGIPVIGLAAASIEAAPGRFAILTAGAGWVPILREQIAASGEAGRCSGILALEATGADFRQDPASFIGALDGLAARAVAAGADSVILGGAVLAGYAGRLRPIVPFIDCVEAAVRCCLRSVASQPAEATGSVGTNQPRGPSGLSSALLGLLGGMKAPP